MRKLYSNTPIIYMLDDHDCGANNANGTHNSTANAVAAYKNLVPGSL